MEAAITAERPDTADARALIDELEAHLATLYPRESRHGYSVEKLIAQGVAFFLVRDNGTPVGCGGVQLPVETMHERKQRMAQLANAFVALPGGIGTLEEVIEIFTWLQLGLHLKPVGLLNARGFYDLLLQFLAHMRDEQFLSPKHHSMLAVSTDAEALLDHLTSTMHVHVLKPISHAATNAA